MINEANLGSMLDPQNVKLELGSLSSSASNDFVDFVFNAG
jgi:hypothetical protein